MENHDLFGNVIQENELLRDTFIEPPFSVLDSRHGAWQARKRAWQRIGIRSHLGRDTEAVAQFDDDIDESTGLNKYGRKPMSGVSTFDPALCELMYRWFCPPGGKVIDPFAGGSVRGIIANYIGLHYSGIDIRQEQVDSNREQAMDILPVNNQPQWYVGDSAEQLKDFKEPFDMVFTCPPYADLEVYSDLPGDVSNMEYEPFMTAYRDIIKLSVALLKRGSFACWIVGDIRDKKGYYRNFVSHTKQAFIDAGCGLYNEAILLQPLGTAMLRAPRVFRAGKKLTKVHENVLVFKKL